LAAGTLKSPFIDVVGYYAPRLKGVSIQEIQAKGQLEGTALQTAEEKLFCKALNNKDYIVLDKGGVQVTSEQLSAILNQLQEKQGQAWLIIGGADGLSPPMLKNAHRKIAFGNVVWPHQLVRGMLMEQLYRAQCIDDGHPYHRG
jgi:23S rRNA (pseudouridine1915-N3)-methyltransferase